MYTTANTFQFSFLLKLNSFNLDTFQSSPIAWAQIGAFIWFCRSVVLDAFLEVVVVRRIINLGYWEFGMGREWEGVEEEGVSL
jgi:hypothetical protein